LHESKKTLQTEKMQYSSEISNLKKSLVKNRDENNELTVK